MEWVILFLCLAFACKYFQNFWTKVVQTARQIIIHLNPGWYSMNGYTSGFV